MLPTKDESDLLSGWDIDAIIAALTLEEKVAMMSGSGFYRIHSEAKKWGAKPYPAGGANERLGIEGLKFSDGPRGVIVGHSTCFPCSMARGASFDRVLEYRIGEAMAKEARAQGVNLLGNVCVNLLRHPAWGRAQETYGEDSYLVGELGAALSKGTQHHNVIATVKHFAANSLENTRFKLNVRLDERTLREVYLPHFRKVIDAGCLSVMSAYNKVNGEYCSQNSFLLNTILRDEWGFEGFVHSDWVLGVYSPHAAEAGLDIENPEPAWFGDNLLRAVRDGQFGESVVDKAVRRILSVLDRVSNANDPLKEYSATCIASAEHRLLAREAAEKSAVLLKNEGILPLSRDAGSSIGVFGKLADLENTGDRGSSRVSAPNVVTPLKGLKDSLGDNRVIFAGDERDVPGAAKCARNFDAAIVVLGYTFEDEGEFIPADVNLGQEEIPENLAAILDGVRARGEKASIGGDRSNISLPQSQIDLVRAVAAANPNTIVVVVAGSAVMVEEWIDEVPAVLQTFYAGMEGGAALARLIFGDVSPSGRLPFTVASNPAHYPYFDRTTEDIEYGYWHGYQLFERFKRCPRYPFGFGLTYSRFEYSDLQALLAPDGSIEVRVKITNKGEAGAIETPQLYISWPGKAAERPLKSLRGFDRVELDPGESRDVQFEVAPMDLAWCDVAAGTWRTETGEHILWVGRSSSDPNSLSTSVIVERELELGL